MTKWIKQNTAACMSVGPFLSTSDGVTSKEAFTSLSGVMYKNNAASTVVTGSVSASHTASGMYHIELVTGCVDTLGHLRYHFANSTCHLPVWEDYVVVPSNTYDALIGGTVGLSACLAASGLSSSAIAKDAADKIADHMIRRGFNNAATSVFGDTKAFRSLLGAVAKLVNKLDASGSGLEVFEADDATLLGTQAITSSSVASPMVTVDTN